MIFIAIITTHMNGQVKRKRAEKRAFPASVGHLSGYKVRIGMQVGGVVDEVWEMRSIRRYGPSVFRLMEGSLT